MSNQTVARPASLPSYRVARPGAGIDNGSKRLLMVVGGIVAAFVLLVGGWTVMRRHGGAIPVIEADSRPLRVKPDNPGGMQVVGADEQVMNGTERTGPLVVSRAPEAPAPQALRAQQGQLPATVPPPGPSVLPDAAQPPAADAPRASAATPSPVAPIPVPVPNVRPAQPATRPSGTGTTMVQLAATDSEQAATGEWARLSKRLPDLLGHHRLVLQKVERDGKQVWRVRTGGFADIADATAFCGKVRSKGTSCAVAAF